MNLYHYTDQTGFIGIMKNRLLWATKIQYLNDHNEYELAIKIASENINKRLKIVRKRLENENDIDKDMDMLYLYQEFLTKIDFLSGVNICVCSLTEQGDLLSQWRGYSNKLGGYSIGFDFDGIKNVAEQNGFKLVKCIYDELEQKDNVEQLINESIKLMNFNKKYTDSVDYFNEELLNLAPLLKDSSFSEENEWRLVAIKNTSDLNFRAGNSMLIPYVDIDLGDQSKVRDILKEVIVGHTPNIELASDSTNSFLCNVLLKDSDYPININSFNISKSIVPYRSW